MIDSAGDSCDLEDEVFDFVDGIKREFGLEISKSDMDKSCMVLRKAIADGNCRLDILRLD